METERVGKIVAIQKILGVLPDGVFGPKSQAALDNLIRPKNLVGDPSWDFLNARIDGADIVISQGIVTAFGGPSDSVDSHYRGATASGLNTSDNPSFLGCALPMRRDASIALKGSPLPKLPWKTTVIFSDPESHISVSTKLIDEGPAGWTRKSGDLTVAAAKLFDPMASSNNFRRRLNIRIIGGAQYV